MTLAAREVGIWLGTPNGGAIVEAIAQSFPRNAGKPPRFWRSTLLFSFMRAATSRFSALELSGHARHRQFFVGSGDGPMGICLTGANQVSVKSCPRNHHCFSTG